MNPVNWEAPEKKKCETCHFSQKKSKPIRFKKQALSEIASELKPLTDSSVRQYQMTIEAERKREERNMAFRKVESEKKRVHELCIVEIFSRSCQQAQMLQPQQPVISRIEPQFLLYHMQSPTSNTRKE